MDILGGTGKGALTNKGLKQWWENVFKEMDSVYFLFCTLLSFRDSSYISTYRPTQFFLTTAQHCIVWLHLNLFHNPLLMHSWVGSSSLL